MESMQLEMFVAVVEEGSVSAASERVFRTQPAVSIAVRKLEEEFGSPLFDRSKRYSFRLTQAGESLYGYARKMLGLRHKRVADAFMHSKIPLHLQVENAPIEAIKKMAAIGLGAGFVPLLCVKEEVARGELATIEMEGFREIRSLWLVRRWAQQSHAVEAFMKAAWEFRAGLVAKANAELRTKTNKVVAVNHRG